jgi:hypothetical protein
VAQVEAVEELVMLCLKRLQVVQLIQAEAEAEPAMRQVEVSQLPVLPEPVVPEQ